MQAKLKGKVLVATPEEGVSLRESPNSMKTFGGQFKCRSFVSLYISSLKTFGRLRTRRFAPAMPHSHLVFLHFPRLSDLSRDLSPHLAS